ncbi:MAG: hypothetical protein IPM17_03975 [Verrucomicrobia bacterium]|nr:hypothetical protein [Verrucomicrobiota bacterium]
MPSRIAVSGAEAEAFARAASGDRPLGAHDEIPLAKGTMVRLTANALQLRSDSQSAQSLPRRGALAGLLAFAFLLAQSVAASSLLHHWLHDDTNAPDHHCQVTTLSHGQETPVTTVKVPRPGDAATGDPIRPDQPAVVGCRFLLLPGRAPPLHG